MNISTRDAVGLYTKKLLAVYRDSLAPTKFISSFFKPDESDTLEVSIMVQRDTEKIAVDVVRGSDGNRNTFSNTTEKIFIPPYFNEYWDVTSLDFYDRLWQASEISSTMFAKLVKNGVAKTQSLVNKIERTYELQRIQVLETGIVTFTQGPVASIDFKRKAASLVNNGTYYFAANNDYTLPFIEAGDFLRSVGKYNGGVLNAIFGKTAIADLMKNTTFTQRQNLFNLKLDSITPPQRNSEGGILLGYIIAGPYIVNIWTYPQFYDNSAGVSTQYINPKKVIVIPESPNFIMSYAAVPQLLEPGEPIKKGAYLFSEFTDQKRKTREYHTESAGVPIPVAVDQIYTFQAVA